MKVNWNSMGGGGLQNKKPSLGGIYVWIHIFSGTAQFISEHSHWAKHVARFKIGWRFILDDNSFLI